MGYCYLAPDRASDHAETVWRMNTVGRGWDVPSKW
jgi:hypothetical protein